VLGLAVNRDGTRLATSSEDGTVRVWDLEAARELHVLQGHRGIVRGIAFNSDGSRLASGGDDGTVRVWEATSGGELRVLRGHSQWVRAVAFSPDGCWLASAGSDGIIQLWDARPWSAKIGADDEARGLVDGLFALPLQKADVCARIESHRGISEPVRRLAQELAQRHAPLPARKSD
jgi:predicted NACHT family NTPase